MPLDPISPPLPDDLTGLVGSRLCHDLISPLGAIGNGVELLSMSGARSGPELDLIAQAVTSANARLKFFRVAFGQATADQRLGMPEIEALLAETYRGSRLAVSWQATGDQARLSVKLVLLGLLCLETAMPWGGTVTIEQEGASWRLTAGARKTKPDAALWAVLEGAAPHAPMTPAQVQFALLAQEARRQGRVIGWDVAPEGALITF